jgi:NADH:ubiquinone oxidoreductase subunit E
MTIEICMGSSCFTRGNRESLGLIESFLLMNQLKAEVELKGSLCMDCCGKGPHIKINGETFHEVAPEKLEKLLYDQLLSREAEV